jgi:exopolysaccharide biosynthesis polyprenyl glycosylphosphotransferase
VHSRSTRRPVSNKTQLDTTIRPINSIEDAQDRLFPISVGGQKHFGDFVKRLVDFIFAAFLLIVLSPVFLAVAILIKRDSEGPIIFKQRRIGMNGKPFTFLKFRSMFVNNNNEIHKKYVTELIRNSSNSDLKGENGSFKIERDPRVTKIGRILRRTSLDELPQLVNVLKGEMSLVGPRPPLPYEVELYTVKHMKRLDTMPGITGWWQINGRCQKNFEEMIDLDLYYIEHRSIMLDLKILLRTISVVLDRKGAW